MMSIQYEWDWEELDESGAIEEHWVSDKPQRKPFDGNGDMVLCRNNWGSDGELDDRHRAYVENYELPESFDGSGGKVPKAQRAAFERFKATQ